FHLFVNHLQPDLQHVGDGPAVDDVDRPQDQEAPNRHQRLYYHWVHLSPNKRGGHLRPPVTLNLRDQFRGMSNFAYTRLMALNCAMPVGIDPTWAAPKFVYRYPMSMIIFEFGRMNFAPAPVRQPVA